ncbi:MAG TPA: DUF488 family protein [Acidimicrobiales bacterium]|nr:DUF488 family protein [Acidimicrobiales bacterium]
MLTDDVYAQLLALRTGLRQFQRWSEQQAHEAGLTPAQHQLLLAVRGHPDPRGPTIGEVADYLLLRHHSAVGLVDRADAAGLVRRIRDDTDRRVVRLALTTVGARRLEALSALHLEELRRLTEQLPGLWEGLAPAQGTPDGSRWKPETTLGRVDIARVYAEPPAGSAHRVLVDRLWPRGVARDRAPFDEWARDVAPSPELRKWYGHAPERFDEFATRYRSELAQGNAREQLKELAAKSHAGALVLVTATRDIDHSAARVLRDLLTAGEVPP